ncbi:MAG: DUF3144 domain-containing protein [Halioglobus sp.]
MSEADQVRDCMNEFIDLANQMKDRGIPVHIVNSGLMRAFGVYATYSVAGNAGGLTESGVEKIAELFKVELANVQEMRKAELATDQAKE